MKYHFLEIKKSKKKYNEEQVNIMLQYKSQYLDNISNCIKILKLNENIDISKTILKKIMDGTY